MTFFPAFSQLVISQEAYVTSHWEELTSLTELAMDLAEDVAEDVDLSTAKDIISNITLEMPPPIETEIPPPPT